jgi:hypothetical protein
MTTRRRINPPLVGRRLARAAKQDEIIESMNALLNIEVDGGQVRYGREQVRITLPPSTEASGLPDGFAVVEGEIVRDDQLVPAEILTRNEGTPKPFPGGGGFTPRAPLSSSLSRSEALPTVADLRAAIAEAYDDAGLTPRELDMWFSDNDYFHYRISETDLGDDGIIRFSFKFPAVSGPDYYAINIGPNAWV